MPDSTSECSTEIEGSVQKNILDSSKSWGRRCVNQITS
ncbi:hypothetical protein CCY16_00578 [Wolbachia endosymbiont of Wuchereria bancrofti]|nr:hypothetical protein CCY16_00578 [Wolbachia endosymbiont of Wuchereria bancrofti]